MPIWTSSASSAAYAAPGVVEACAWSPPARGSVTIQPTIKYEIILFANGYAETLAPYYRTGPAETFRVGELRAVNVNGSR